METRRLTAPNRLRRFATLGLLIAILSPLLLWAQATPDAAESPSDVVTPATAPAEASPPPASSDLIANLTIFVLAVFVGFEIITKVPPTLHTPLMSGSNAISGITIVGALVIAGQGVWGAEPISGFFAAVLAMINVVGGFLVTHRMLMMFQRKR